MLVFCRCIKGMLHTKVTDSSYMYGWTSEHLHTIQATYLCGMAQYYGQMLRNAVLLHGNFLHLVTSLRTTLVT